VPETDAQPGVLVPIEPAVLARAQAAGPNEVILSGVEAVFRALADPTRTRILYALANGPICVRDLAIKSRVLNMNALVSVGILTSYLFSLGLTPFAPG
jgi:DNA-binding transcriptional ArsR family regulator